MTGPVRTAGQTPSALTLLASLGGAGWLGLVGLLSAPPALAAEPCVGVVVDARLLGGDVRTGCAKGDPDSGLAALTRAGFRYAFVPRQPGLVCQVDGAPECSRTTTTTYWSYWYRPKGSSSWVYASQGAGSHDPPPGSTEAWVWQDGGRREPPDVPLRTICPQLAEPATEKPTPQTSATATRAAEPTTFTSPDRRTSATAGRSTPPKTTARTTAATPTTGSPTPTTTGTATTTPATSLPSTTSAASTRQDDGDASGALPWAGVVIGGGLVGVLGGAAVARSRRAGGSP